MPWRRIPPKLSSSLDYNYVRKRALDKFLDIDCKAGKIDISKAHHFFKEMLHMTPPPTISCFTTLLAALVKCRHFSATLSFYKSMNVAGVPGLKPNLFILNTLLNCYSSMMLERSAGYSALGLILKNGYRPNIRTFNTLVKGLCLKGKVVEAVGLLTKMLRFGCPPDIVTYTTIINGLCKTGNVATALELHLLMISGNVVAAKEGCRPATISYTLIDGGCMEWPMVDPKGRDVRFSPNIFSYNCLIDWLCRLGMNDDAMSLLHEMRGRGIHPNVVTYSILINTLCKKGKVEEAMSVLEMMMSTGEFPNCATYNTIVNGYCNIGKVDVSMTLYEDMTSRGIFADNVTITALLKGLFLVRKVGDAMSLFRNMKKMVVSGACSPDKVTYATMIDGLCKEGHVSEAEDLFMEMQDNGISPNGHVYSALIDGLSKQGHIGKAQKLLLEMLASGVSPDAAVYNALMDGLCKKGDMHKAKELFLQMQNSGISPSVISYNTLINGFYCSGNLEEANLMLEKMIGEGILPSSVTYKIMSNLGKKGEQAERNVISLMESCGYQCNVVSYNALIKGCCKDGKVEDAYNLLAEMEAKDCPPDVKTYSTLTRGFAHEKESARVKELTRKMHDIRISSNSTTTSALLECMKTDDESSG